QTDRGAEAHHERPDAPRGEPPDALAGLLGVVGVGIVLRVRSPLPAGPIQDVAAEERRGQTHEQQHREAGRLVAEVPVDDGDHDAEPARSKQELGLRAHVLTPAPSSRPAWPAPPADRRGGSSRTWAARSGSAAASGSWARA